jgi:hypothetical protein
MKKAMTVFLLLWFLFLIKSDLIAQTDCSDSIPDSVIQNRELPTPEKITYQKTGITLHDGYFPDPILSGNSVFMKSNTTVMAVAKYRLKNLWKEYHWPLILLTAAGFVDAGNQAAQFNYEAFSGRISFLHPNKGWWDPSVSWRNKYKNEDPSQGAKFFLSKSSLVMVTDWYHMSRTIEQLLVMSAVAVSLPSIPITYSGPTKYYAESDPGVLYDAKLIRVGKTRIGQVGKKWYVYIAQTLAGWIINRVFFQLAYDYLTH